MTITNDLLVYNSNTWDSPSDIQVYATSLADWQPCSNVYVRNNLNWVQVWPPIDDTAVPPPVTGNIAYGFNPTLVSAADGNKIVLIDQKNNMITAAYTSTMVVNQAGTSLLDILYSSYGANGNELGTYSFENVSEGTAIMVGSEGGVGNFMVISNLNGTLAPDSYGNYPATPSWSNVRVYNHKPIIYPPTGTVGSYIPPINCYAPYRASPIYNTGYSGMGLVLACDNGYLVVTGQVLRNAFESPDDWYPVADVTYSGRMTLASQAGYPQFSTVQMTEGATVSQYAGYQLVDIGQRQDINGLAVKPWNEGTLASGQYGMEGIDIAVACSGGYLGRILYYFKTDTSYSGVKFYVERYMVNTGEGQFNHALNLAADTNNTFAIYVGNAGVVYLMWYTGSSWTYSDMGNFSAYNLNCSAYNKQALIVVGDHGTIIRTTDFFATHSVISSGTTANLKSVVGLTVDPLYQDWNITGLPDFVITGEDGVMLESYDQGLTWSASNTGYDLSGAASTYYRIIN